MSFLSSRRGVFALSALCVLFPLGAPVAAQDTSAAPSSLPSQSPLRQAKTLRVHETFSIAGKEGLHPIFTMNVQIERPGKVHLDMLPDASFYGKNARASLYVSDGVTQHEYNGLSNKYTSSEAPALGQRATAQICFIADIDLLLSPQGLPTPRTGTTRVVTNTLLDGKPALLTTETEAPRKLPNGSVTPVTKTWIDAATGLPLRRAAYTVQGDKSTINEQLDFTNWEFDKPLPTALFVWNPPQGAEEYNPPKLLAAGIPAPDFAARTAKRSTSPTTEASRS
jgi:outer membrane lipoprotein-sorting protein